MGAPPVPVAGQRFLIDRAVSARDGVFAPGGPGGGTGHHLHPHAGESLATLLPYITPGGKITHLPLVVRISRLGLSASVQSERTPSDASVAGNSLSFFCCFFWFFLQRQAPFSYFPPAAWVERHCFLVFFFCQGVCVFFCESDDIVRKSHDLNRRVKG